MKPIEFLGLRIYPFGLCMALAIALCLLWAARRFKREKLPAGLLSLVAALAIPLGVLCARAGYCLCAFEQVQDGTVHPLSLTEGGFLFYGALLGVALACFLAGRADGVPTARITDALSAPGALLILLGRLAEGLIGENYGWPIADWFAEESGMASFALEEPTFFCRLPFAIRDSYGSYNWAVFLWMALSAGILMILMINTAPGRPGRRSSLFLIVYASLQIIGESLRQGEVLRWGFVRCNQILSGILLAGVLAWCCVRAGKRVSLRCKVLTWVGLIACVLFIIAMEFALEGKIDLIEWVPMDVLYTLGTLVCFGIIFIFHKVWDAATRAESR